MRSVRYFIFLGMLTSCFNSNVERVRIVDSNGNPAKINKIVPKFNEEQLIKQKEAFGRGNNRADANRFRHDYGNMQPINKNSDGTIGYDQNIITFVNNKYPNDIFADRITNYNYIQDTKGTQSNRERIGNEMSENSKNKIIGGNIIDKRDEADVKAKQPKIIDSGYDGKVAKEKQPKIIGDGYDDDGIKTKQPKGIVAGHDSKTTRTKRQNTNVIVEYDDSGLNPKQPKTTIENNTKKPEQVGKPAVAQSGVKKDTGASRKGGKYYIQIGVYSEKKNADTAYKKYSQIDNGIIEENVANGKKKYKVLLGPYADKKMAEKSLERVIKTGHYDVYITEKK